MANAFAQALLARTPSNVTTTTNGDKAYKSTGNKVLDFFSTCGALRKSDKNAQISIFESAFLSDPLLAMKALFYARDVRGGAGERELFRTIFKTLANHVPEVVKSNLAIVSEFGRWDDLLVLLGTPVEKDVLDLIKNQISKDIATPEDKSISLLAKWLPSENASSKQSKIEAKKIMASLGLTPRKYRKLLVKLRSRLNVVETAMSAKDWLNIEYAKVPSRAGMIYRKSFLKRDYGHYSSYLEKVTKGEAKINANGIFPYELMHKALASYTVDQTLELQWKALPNYIPEGFKGLAMADTSGSMSCTLGGYGSNIGATCIEASVAMAIYLAEKNDGPFKDIFVTFSETPKIAHITGNSLKEKFQNTPKIVANTDLQKGLDLILDIAVRNRIKREDMIDTLFIFSDMQFDGPCNAGRYNKTTYEHTKEKFNRAGYEMPSVVFWNLNAKPDNKPALETEFGVKMVSGFSVEVFKSVFLGATPLDNMLETLNSERYNAVKI